MRFYFRLFERNHKPSLGALLDYMKASATLLKQNEATLSELSDAVAAIQADVAALGPAITDVKTRVDTLVASGSGDAADVAAAVSALQQAHTDLGNSTAALGAIAPPS
jgi:ABC-type transporter Mla subunit MlaD